MTGVKQQVRDVLEQLPDNCSLEDVQYGLYVLETLRKRTESAERGDFVGQDEVERQLRKWLRK